MMSLEMAGHFLTSISVNGSYVQSLVQLTNFYSSFGCLEHSDPASVGN